MSNNRSDRFNGSGYYDPTAYEALRNISRSERKEHKGKQSAPKIYICSPYRGDTENNVRNARRYCRFAVEQGCFPIAPHLFLPQFMNDNIRSERELALSFGLRLLNGCKEMWIFGNKISEGMQMEIDAAKHQNKSLRFFTSDLKEVRGHDLE